ncbi:DUF2330 domain-containing protein [Actinokineospora sp. HUAS TT18]|uniref:DUF2330 domain-containing protein n=1 Tax=Actinokineospora sp. HUAS TT18 TaxID=3447451 RepID=UPI003F51C6C6
MWRNALAVLLFLALYLAGPGTAHACACGAVVPSDPQAKVAGEIGLVRWDGTREVLDLAMFVRGKTKDAAWIMPAPPDTEVTLGDDGLFDRLAQLTKPRVVKRYQYWPDFEDGKGSGGAAAGPGGAVTVEGTSTIGPFEVTRLSGTDAAAVAGWLTEHGYPARPELTPTLRTYLDQGWQLLAVKLSPTGDALTGQLTPLRLSFPATKPVYPISLSRHAASTHTVITYVAAPHRVELDAETSSSVTFAGWVDGRDVRGPEGERLFLTKISQQVRPAAITGDFTYSTAPTDNEYQEVVYVTVDRSWVGPAAVALILVALWWIAARLRRAKRAA